MVATPNVLIRQDGAMHHGNVMEQQNSILSSCTRHVQSYFLVVPPSRARHMSGMMRVDPCLASTSPIPVRKKESILRFDATDFLNPCACFT